MAEGDATVYNELKEELLRGTIDLDGGHTLKLILVGGYTPDIDNDVGYNSAITAYECSGAGYTVGGKTLTNPTVTKNNINNRGEFDADNVTWIGLDVGTPSHAILYDDTHVSDAVVACWELGRASNGGNYTVQWGANGLLLLT